MGRKRKNKKRRIWLPVIMIIVIIGALFLNTSVLFDEGLPFIPKIEKEYLMVMGLEDDKALLEDQYGIIYTIDDDDIEALLGSDIAVLKKEFHSDGLNLTIDDYEIMPVFDNDILPYSWRDDGIYSKYYKMAYEMVGNMSLDDKISQILLVRYPYSNQVKILDNYKFGGYIFFENDFSGKSREQVVKMINSVQEASKIPMLIAVDEEGGTVVRVSSNYNLVKSRFSSPRYLYNHGGLDKIREDTVYKSKVLSELGINLNLAPVVDISTNPNDYMYYRSIGENSEVTGNFAKTVIEASKGTGLSYTLKHFPGYGNNADTHIGSSVDKRTYDDIMNNDIVPFKMGIDASAEAIMVSHNTVTSIDSDNPASLSAKIHNLLRDNLKFTGIIVTDDIVMGALRNKSNTTLKSVMAGNDLIITTNYEKSINEIKKAIDDGILSENYISKLAFRIIAWKYYKGLIVDN